MSWNETLLPSQSRVSYEEMGVWKKRLIEDVICKYLVSTRGKR